MLIFDRTKFFACLFVFALGLSTFELRCAGEDEVAFAPVPEGRSSVRFGGVSYEEDEFEGYSPVSASRLRGPAPGGYSAGSRYAAPAAGSYVPGMYSSGGAGSAVGSYSSSAAYAGRSRVPALRVSNMPVGGPVKASAKRTGTVEGYNDQPGILAKKRSQQKKGSKPGFFDKLSAGKAVLTANTKAVAAGDHFYRDPKTGDYMDSSEAERLIRHAKKIDEIVDRLDDRLYKELHQVQEELVRRLSTIMMDEQERITKLGVEFKKILNQEDYEDLESGVFNQEIYDLVAHTQELIEGFNEAYDNLINTTEERALEMADMLTNFYQRLRVLDTKIGPHLSQGFARRVGTTLSRFFMDIGR